MEEYANAFEAQLTSRTLSPEGTSFFHSHDVVHVVFGCDVSLEDEAVVKVSSFFGTNGGSDVLRGYRLPESNEIYGELIWSQIAVTAVKALVLAPRTIWRCTRMTERWPWKDFDGYLETPLDEIRHRFGIKVAH